MKKILALTHLAAVLFGACEKESKTTTQELSPNRVINIPANDKTAGSTILMMNIGHDGRNCNGCVRLDGEMVHVNCMGEGNYCAKASAVQLQQSGTAVTATTTDTFGLTSEDFFLMPARSLNYTDEHNNRVYLNIPAQFLIRDTVTQQFTFTGLSFSSTAAYSNN